VVVKFVDHSQRLLVECFLRNPFGILFVLVVQEVVAMGHEVEKRQAAIRQLRENAWDFEKTAKAADISRSTLERWFKEEVAKAGSIESTLTEVERRICLHALELASLLMLEDDETTLTQRANALGLVINSLMKIETHQREQMFDPTAPIRVVFVDPDGSEHDAPMWEREGEDKKAGQRES